MFENDQGKKQNNKNDFEVWKDIILKVSIHHSLRVY